MVAQLRSSRSPPTDSQCCFRATGTRLSRPPRRRRVAGISNRAGRSAWPHGQASAPVPGHLASPAGGRPPIITASAGCSGSPDRGRAEPDSVPGFAGWRAPSQHYWARQSRGVRRLVHAGRRPSHGIGRCSPAPQHPSRRHNRLIYAPLDTRPTPLSAAPAHQKTGPGAISSRQGVPQARHCGAVCPVTAQSIAIMRSLPPISGNYRAPGVRDRG
jgi:hypothetical protein